MIRSTTNDQPAARSTRGGWATLAVAAAALTVAAAGATPASAALPPGIPPGFVAYAGGEGIADPPRFECYLVRQLQCRGIGRVPADASCDFGGAVSLFVLPRQGRGGQTHGCIDEAFHDWPALPLGRRWSARGYTCRVGLVGQGIAAEAVLGCRAPSGHGFVADGSAHARRTLPSARRP